jgi:deoxyribodipyrimidine photo-lyase
VFNPTSQAERFDPEGAYVRRWVPELADLDGTTIHTPAGRVRLGDEAGDYPSPIVDHAAERDEALRRYRSVTAERR